MAASTETKTSKEMLEILLKAGFYVWRNNTGMAKMGGRFVRFGKVGSSDIIGVCPDGRFFALENKSNGEPLTIHQKAFLDEVSFRGGIAEVAHSVDAAVKLVQSFKCQE